MKKHKNMLPLMFFVLFFAGCGDSVKEIRIDELIVGKWENETTHEIFIFSPDGKVKLISDGKETDLTYIFNGELIEIYFGIKSLSFIYVCGDSFIITAGDDSARFYRI